MSGFKRYILELYASGGIICIPWIISQFILLELKSMLGKYSPKIKIPQPKEAQNKPIVSYFHGAQFFAYYRE